MSAAFYRALVNRLARAGVPVYAEGLAPEGTGFPCITFRAEIPAPGEAGRGHITCWTRDDDRGCLAMMAQLKRREGPAGMLLTFAGGAAMLRWQQTERVTDGDGVAGCRVRFTLHGMIGEEETDADGDPRGDL